MDRNDNRPKFTPDTSVAAPNTVEEQEEDHKNYWDRQHDIELAKKLKTVLNQKGLEIHSDRGDTSRLFIEAVRELRLTTY